MISSKLKPIKLFCFVLKTVFYILICLLLLNCEEQPILEFDEKTFYREWAAWEALGITDYSVTSKTEFHWPSTHTMSTRLYVKNNNLYKVEPLDDHKADYILGGNPISRSYPAIKSTYESHKNVRGSIKIIYNKDFHYPEVVYYDLPPKDYSPNVLGRGVSYYLDFTLTTPETD